MGGWDSDNAFQIDFSIRSSSPTLARRGCRSWSASTTASAARAVDAALGDPTPGLRIEDQLMREALAQPAARHRLQAILDAGAQTRDFELGGSRH
jgi:hypothetical protein